MFFYSATEALVPANPPQFDQRLPLKRCRPSLCAVITLEFIEWQRPSARVTVRTKPEVDVKDSAWTRFDEIDCLPRQRFEVRCVLGLLVNEDHFQIRGISHFASTELTQPTDSK